MQAKHGAIFIPQQGAEEKELLDLKEKWFNDDGTFRNYILEEMCKALHYAIGNQWIELDTRLIRGGSGGYKFKQKDPGARYPKPTTNLVGSSVEVEMSSLAKRELVPNVLTTSKDPRIQAAARVAKEVLNYRLEQTFWQSKREEVTYLSIVTGTGIMKSYWDEPVTEVTYIANPQASICPECATTMASPTIASGDVGAFGIKHMEHAAQSPNQTPGMDTNFDTTMCPTCDEPTEMTPFDMTQEDAAGVDHLGRPMGTPIAKGNTEIEVVSPFDFFPENSGVGVLPTNMKFFGQATVRSLEWICARWPEAQVEPEDAAQLMKVHPLLGEHRFYGNYTVGYDSNIYGNHARVYEFYAEKCYGHPEGRAIIYVNDKVISDGPLYRTVNGVSVPLVKYGMSRFKEKHGIFWGQGLVENLISPQNRLNGMDSQVVDARERTGSPNLIIPENCGVDGPEFFEDEYGGAKIFRFKTDPLNPQGKPEVFGSTLFPSGVWEERNNVKEDMRQIAGPQDIELGEAPKNISTTSGLQILGEQAERRRAARERSLIDMFQVIWEHQLRLIWTLRVEPDEYEVQDTDGNWEKKQYDRQSIKGQTRVKIEKQAYVDRSLIIKEGAREAQIDGLYQLDSPMAVKRLLELRGLPTDVNQNQNDQVDGATQQYTDFTDEGIMPYIDPSIDDSRIHFQTLGTYLKSQEGMAYTAKVGWPQIVKNLAGWEMDLQQAELMDQQVRAFYGSEGPPEQMNELYAQGMKSYAVQDKAFKMSQSAPPPPGVDPMMAGAAMQPPQPPPPPIFIPRAKEDRVLMIWMKLLELKGLSPQAKPQVNQLTGGPAIDLNTGEPVMAAPTISPELMTYIQFRAVVEAYRLLAEEKEMKAMMGMPTAPAPGTPEGSPGTPGQNAGLQQPPAPKVPQAGK